MNQERIEFDIPQGVRSICDILVSHGEDGFLVGGSLRDLILGCPPGDWDLATTATPSKMMRIFRRVIPTGIEHGTVTVIINRETYEVTTLRSDDEYTDGRHPDSVKFVTNIEEDLSRRDLTINAIAWNPISKIISDPFNGRGDIADKCLRAVGDPLQRFDEDGLRIMRAARFAATLEFGIHKDTLNALAHKVERLQKVSTERKRDELIKLLLANKPSFGLHVLNDNGILPYLCDALAESAHQGHWGSIVQRVDNIGAKLHLRLAALFLDVAVDKLDAWMNRFIIDKRTKKKVRCLVGQMPLQYDESFSDVQVRKLAMQIGKEYLDDLCQLSQAAAMAYISPVDIQRPGLFSCRLKRMNMQRAVLSISELAVSGKKLMDALGVPSGKHVGRILDYLLQCVIEDPDNNNEARLIELAKKRESF